MDDEDLADAEEARKLQTTESFTGLGLTAEEQSQKESIMDILRTTGDTMGIKLLRKMGWREGQGIGPRVRRKARIDEEDDPGGATGQDTHLFAPENTSMVSFVRKNDRKGIGFQDQRRLPEPIKGRDPDSERGNSTPDEGKEQSLGAVFKSSKLKKNKEVRGGFGVGILNDNGSDDEDPYHVGPQISYNRIIGGEKKKERPENGKSTANPLLSNKPIFISKKAGTKTSTFRRCHDGRLPVTGFVLSTNLDPLSSILSQDGKYRPIPVPIDWKSKKIPANSSNVVVKLSQTYQSPAAVAKASTLSPKSRAAILGETPLPGKSVFDFLTPSARSRIASATNNPHLPIALSKAPTEPTDAGPNTKSQHSLIPPLPPEVALSALGRGTAGWMPYSDDPPKLARYRNFLEICASVTPNSFTAIPDRAPGASTEDWVKEMQEFSQSAQMFKPMTGGMAKRFTSASAVPQNVSDLAGDSSAASADTTASISHPVRDPAAQAAELGMFGLLTRSVTVFAPTRLLCKRFNVKPPAHFVPDSTPAASISVPATASSYANLAHQASVLPQGRLEPPVKDESDIRMRVKDEDNAGTSANGLEGPRAIVIDPERNEALERERPDDAIFRAVFGGESDEEEVDAFSVRETT
jgi:G patch domain-containing protein 1